MSERITEEQLAEWAAPGRPGPWRSIVLRLITEVCRLREENAQLRKVARLAATDQTGLPPWDGLQP